ncbi:MAG: hypothetical protein MI808_23045, partial [Pseudomonadales bacterium]|nr:hypothetical protein [Pseudomonadales bacterium]
KRIYGYVDHVAKQFSDIQFIKADYLNDHEKVIDAFEFRVREIMEGIAPQESLMSSFKRRLAAGEVDVHHHHAEFNPNQDHSHDHSHSHDHEHSHSHGHSHSHDHDHHHHHGVYQHIGHPLGPRTMIGDGICNCFMRQFPQEILDEEKERISKMTDEEPLAHRQ